MTNFKYCIKCGRHIPKNAQVCPYCGAEQSQLPPQYQNRTKKVYHTSEYTSFPKAIVSFWKNYFNVHGTSSRSAFWWWKLCQYLIMFLLIGLMIGLGIRASLVDTLYFLAPSCYLAMASGIVLIIFTLAIVIPTITLVIRRLRDAGLNKNSILLLLFLDYFSWLIPGFYPISLLATALVLVLTIMPTNTFKDSKF